ncbi:hypothetical protein [Agrobacterium sp. T29]|uniref:hypothetical protein n=1 Tax=Agrobacterium sp. T29 TaxID=2580515 RepID=UPI00115F3F4D|nr:hypothetical protein [Agrobacterium sp. T29]
MYSIVFPEVVLPHGVSLWKACTSPRDYIANPKAVAAQTFKSPQMDVPYHDSEVWSEVASLFAVQYPRTAAVDISFETHLDCPWIAFPWAICKGLASRACLVWVDDRGKRRLVRHIRLYPNGDHLEEDHRWLEHAVRKAIPSSLIVYVTSE